MDKIWYTFIFVFIVNLIYKHYITTAKVHIVLYILCFFCVYVVVQFFPWFKFYFPLFLGMVMYDNEF